MRRIRHLEQTDYVVAIGSRNGSLLALSNNCYLDRTWDNGPRPDYELSIHAKFNSSAMQGLTAEVRLMSSYRQAAVAVPSISVYRVSNLDFSKTLIGSFTPTASGLSYVLTLTQAQLGANELSGAETYYLEANATRRLRKFKCHAYVNHLGCFDSINRLRQSMEYNLITKLDE